MNSYSFVRDSSIRRQIFYFLILSVSLQSVFVIKLGAITTVSLFDLVTLAFLFFSILYGIQARLLSHFFLLVLFLSILALLHGVINGRVSIQSYALFFVRFYTCLLIMGYAYSCIADKEYVASILNSTCIMLVISLLFSYYESFLVLRFGFQKLAPAFLDGAGDPISRIRGFFSEPSLYAVFMFPLLVYVLDRKRYFLAVLFLFSLVMTASSFILPAVIILFILYVADVKSVLKWSVLALVGGYVFAFFFGIDFLIYSMVDKVRAYVLFSGESQDVGGSGSIRAYTSMLGIRGFLENLFIGVGVGEGVAYTKSVYDYSLVESGFFSESVPIQSSLPQVLCEQGLMALIPVSMFLYWLGKGMLTLKSRDFYSMVLYSLYVYLLYYPLQNPLLVSFVVIFYMVLKARDFKTVE